MTDFKIPNIDNHFGTAKIEEEKKQDTKKDSGSDTEEENYEIPDF